MAPPRPTSMHPRIWIIVVLAIIGLGTLSVRLAKPASPERVLILDGTLQSQGKEIGPGLVTLLTDCLEVCSGATVTHAPALPSAADLKRLPPQTRLVRFHASRSGELLTLTLEWNTVSRLLADKPWAFDAAPPQPPERALREVVQHWPLAIRYRHLDLLIPKNSAHVWSLLEGMSIRDDRAATDHLTESEQLAQDEPNCATAWATLGDHYYRSLWVQPEQAGIGLNSRTHRAFKRTVTLVPGHPRATFLWSMMLTDMGNQSLALQILRDGVRLRPGIPDMYLGIAYAGRTSGLLENARRALIRRSDLMGPLAAPSDWFAETTYLYLGDLEAFEGELTRAGTVRHDANLLFYQGYFSLLRGQPGQALDYMRVGSDPARLPTPFRDLCRVYRAYLEGRSSDGLLVLREIDEIRGKLRIPDGEWTFKEAEAYALLGDADRGVDSATRAFVQGFSCLAWYEKSPFLEKVRRHPRWPMLHRNIRERQALLAGSFPPSAFEP